MTGNNFTQKSNNAKYKQQQQQQHNNNGENMEDQTISMKAVPTKVDSEEKHCVTERIEDVGENARLSKEEAWQLYLKKLDEEAGYLSVTADCPGTALCICTHCVVSVTVLHCES